ncbi:ATP-binding protein [Vreelandella rituensis]|uniref:Uncharacterized protein n=1 Tax=Vreelandella rituensis TaxID=2282306 RepID=A0A368UAY0_9GAMM|nr:ATP-binding protein [Halomonas rituensis]RCV93697.1 hypothetical protein DU506_00660 [Halomonas rituensis]
MTALTAPEARQFTVHPAIIKSIIREQAGSPDKAIAELIMNSVDAGATRVDITFEDGTLTIKDDGRGFSSREEILQVFETFGLPHEEGDAIYGRFRVGRGQIMVYGKVSWRSGHYEMVADLAGEVENFGYHLQEHDTFAEGCTVTVTGTTDPYKPYSLPHSSKSLERDLAEMVAYVAVPVTFNGTVINTLPSQADWTDEDDHAFYSLNRTDWELLIYNKGVMVAKQQAHWFGVGGVVNTKQPLALNMARNAILCGCDVWSRIKLRLKAHYQKRLARVQQLKDHEVPALLEWIVHTDDPIPHELQRKIRSLRFMVDIFGNKQSPEKMLTAERFTLHDRTHITIAEHVHRSGMASVIMPQTIGMLTRGNPTDQDAVDIIGRLIKRLAIFPPNGKSYFKDFQFFVNSLDDTTDDIKDSQLTNEEMLVLRIARAMNVEIYNLVRAPGGVRKISAGKADKVEAWTDGCSYIQIDRGILKNVRHHKCGVNKLVALIVHEYCHGDSTSGTHSHDYDFYQQFHEAILDPDFGKIVDAFFRRYVSGLCRKGIVPSGEHGQHIKQIAKLAQDLPTRSTRKAAAS